MIDDEQVYVTDQGLVVVGLTQSSDDPTMFTQDVEGTEVTVSLDRIHKGKEQTVAIFPLRSESFTGLPS